MFESLARSLRSVYVAICCPSYFAANSFAVSSFREYTAERFHFPVACAPATYECVIQFVPMIPKLIILRVVNWYVELEEGSEFGTQNGLQLFKMVCFSADS